MEINDALDLRILDRFFHIMVRQSEYGYVLDDTKPISAIDLSSLESLPAPESPWFLLNICSLEAIEVWNRMHHSKSDIVLKTTKIFDHDSNTTQYELLFINIPKLREVIESNINLFRYVLGPSLETTSLLNHILESSDSLYTLLRNDRVLVGIVLGFGAYNSLMCGRTETLNNTLNDADVPPFSRRSDLMHANIDTLRSHAFFLSSINNLSTDSPHFTPPMRPSLGFTSTTDELKFIDSQQIELPEALSKEEPQFIFGSYKHAENYKLLDDLQATQRRIRTDLDRSDFLEHILEKITGEKPIINCISHQNERFVLQSNVEHAVAKVLWHTYSQLDHWAVSEFVEAFCRRNAQDKQRPKVNLMPGSLSGLEQAQLNLKFAEEQLFECSQKELIQEIIPNYLYFERIKVGNGSNLNGAGELLMSYVIEDGHGNVLSAHHNCWIPLAETIPGFILGIQGMQEGEMRKIYMHPAYGYGISTNLPPCTFLIASITLHQVNIHSKHVPPSLIPLDLSWLKDPEIYRDIEQSSLQLARSLGSMWGVWLSRSPDLDFLKLCQELRNLMQTNDIAPSLSCEEQRLCNHVFWNL